MSESTSTTMAMRRIPFSGRLLEQDVAEKLMQHDLKRLVAEERNKRVGVVGLGGDNRAGKRAVVQEVEE
jgi:hypothetical protein